MYQLQGIFLLIIGILFLSFIIDKKFNMPSLKPRLMMFGVALCFFGLILIFKGC
jgi:hypothetical protein